MEEESVHTEYDPWDRIVELEHEFNDFKERVLSNINARLIELEGHIYALDVRTQIFVPRRTKDE